MGSRLPVLCGRPIQFLEEASDSSDRSGTFVSVHEAHSARSAARLTPHVPSVGPHAQEPFSNECVERFPACVLVQRPQSTGLRKRQGEPW
jgi:hypothetical protein